MAARKPSLPMDLPEVPRSQPRAPAAATAAPGPLVTESDWSVVDHVCGRCFGRLLGRIEGGKRLYRCASCGHHTDPETDGLARVPPPGRTFTPAVCACQLKFAGKDAGIRCVVNDRRGPQSPTEIVARQVL